jgi:hypothetical protein
VATRSRQLRQKHKIHLQLITTSDSPLHLLYLLATAPRTAATTGGGNNPSANISATGSLPTAKRVAIRTTGRAARQGAGMFAGNTAESIARLPRGARPAGSRGVKATAGKLGNTTAIQKLRNKTTATEKPSDAPTEEVYQQQQKSSA